VSTCCCAWDQRYDFSRDTAAAVYFCVWDTHGRGEKKNEGQNSWNGR
jgi:hypothetical protein